MSPDIDLFTLLSSMLSSLTSYSSPSINQATPDSEHCAVQEDTPLHLEVANLSNVVTKSTLRTLAKCFDHALRSHFGIGAPGPNKDVVVVMTSGQPLSTASLPQCFLRCESFVDGYRISETDQIEEEQVGYLHPGSATGCRRAGTNV